MIFSPFRITNADTGRSAEVHVWDTGLPDIGTTDGVEGTVAIDGRLRTLSPGPLAVLRAFEHGPEERQLRTDLRHDCAVYAYEHQTGKSARHLRFGMGSSHILGFELRNVRSTTTPFNLAEPDSHTGDVVMLLSSAMLDPATETSSDHRHPYHYMVRADVDDEGPVYLSKLGVTGPVVAHDFDAAHELYTVDTTAIATLKLQARRS